MPAPPVPNDHPQDTRPLADTSTPLAACSGDDAPDVSKEDVVAHYAVGVHATYQASLASATDMSDAIDAFLANPAPHTLEAAKRAWLTARDDYGVVQGPGLADLVAADDRELADLLTSQISRSVANARAIPAPFDASLVPGLADSSPRRRAVLAAIESLEDQTDNIVAAAEALGVSIDVT